MNLLRLGRNQWDRTLAVVLVVAGLVSLIVGYVAVSGTVKTFDQIPYVISGGLLGLCLVALGCASWVSADLRDEWRKLDRLEAAVAALAQPGENHETLVLPASADDVGRTPAEGPGAPGKATGARAVRASGGA